MKGPFLTLNNGVEMPALGLGVYQSGPEETVEAVHVALADGYRMIDTAAAYMNEEQVGQGIRESGVARSDVFVQDRSCVLRQRRHTSTTPANAGRRARRLSGTR